MAKSQYRINKPVTLTVEQDGHQVRYNTRGVTFEDHGYGGYTELTATGLIASVKAPEPRTDVQNETPITQNNEQAQGLNVVAQKAKAIERQKLMNARAVESAIREARKLEAAAQHEFNMAVLQALHTGLSQETIEKHLTDLHLDYTERVDNVRALDTELLYTLDMPNP